jgi:cytidine deaminase
MKALGRSEAAELVEAARAVRHSAYAPYSHYRVGSAIRTASGRIFTGCNVENATYGATLCAERSALAAMVAAGEREPVACAVVTSGAKPGAPCGICRQVLAEFAQDLDLLLASVDARDRVRARRRLRLGSLLPHAFRLLPPPR